MLLEVTRFRPDRVQMQIGAVDVAGRQFLRPRPSRVRGRTEVDLVAAAVRQWKLTIALADARQFRRQVREPLSDQMDWPAPIEWSGWNVSS